MRLLFGFAIDTICLIESRDNEIMLLEVDIEAIFYSFAELDGCGGILFVVDE